MAVDAGRVEYDGRDVTSLAPHQRCRAGIGRSYQVPQPFGAMTVFENLVTAACFGGGQPEHAAWETAEQVLRQTGLLAHANKAAGGLTLLTANGWNSRVRSRPGRSCCCSTRSPAG